MIFPFFLRNTNFPVAALQITKKRVTEGERRRAFVSKVIFFYFYRQLFCEFLKFQKPKKKYI